MSFVKKSAKRALSIMLVLALVMGSAFTGGLFANWGGAVYADSEYPTATVTIASQAMGGFLHPITTTAVSADLAESYGYTDTVASSSAVSALDVLVKAHELVYEGDFTTESCGDYLVVPASGFVTKEFGVETDASMYFVNGIVPNDGVVGAHGANGYMVNQAEVVSGDLVEFYLMQDGDTYLDNYAYFMQDGEIVRNIYALTGENINLTLKGYCAMYYGTFPEETIISTHSSELNGANIYTITATTGATAVLTGKTTDDDGKVTLSFDEAGTYYITIDPEYTDDSDNPCKMPVLKICVSETSTQVANDVKVTLVNSDSTGFGCAHPVILEELDVNSFDIRPFMTGDVSSYTPTASVKTANALIEAVYYSIYGTDPTQADLTVAAESTTATAIKAKLNIGMADWGDGPVVSQNSIYGKSDYQMSAINNAMGSSIGTQAVTDRDNVAFYPYTAKYSYFDVLALSMKVAGGYPSCHFKVRQKSFEWGDPEVVEGGSISRLNDFSPYEYAVTNANGIAEEDVWCDGSENFVIIRSDAAGSNPAYLRVNYTYDSGTTSFSDFEVSEVVSADTSLATFTVNGINASNYQAQNLDLSVVSSDNTITLNVVPTDSEATIQDKKIKVNGSASSVTFPTTAGGSVAVPVSNGRNEIKFTVVNGEDSEVYSLTVVKTTSAADNISAVNRVINGIADYNNYSSDVYGYNWILVKKGAGKNVTAAEKEAFLRATLSKVNAGSFDVGSAAKTAIALSALNIDASRVPKTSSGNTEVNIASIAFGTNAESIPSNYLPYVLMLHDLGNYSCDNANCSREKVIQAIIDKTSDWSVTNPYSQGPDVSGMMIPALAPYYKAALEDKGVNGISAATCAAIKALVETEVSAYSTMQSVDNATINNNANSTAKIISALTSIGINPNTDEHFIKNGKSLIDGLLLFESSDHRLGWTSTTYNSLASEQGLEALGNYKDLLNGGDGNNYAFSATVAPYTEWPDAKLLTDLLVTVPAKTTYNKGETFDADGLVVKAVYNGNASTAETLTSGYTLSPDDGDALNTAGVVTVTVGYGGLTKTFNIIVNENSSTPYEVAKVNITVQSHSGVIASKNGLVIKEGVTTAMDALKSVLNDAGKTCVIEKGGTYVASIDGLGEMDKGPNSGWMYNVNNVTVQTSANEYVLNGGEEILWYYTLDWKKDSRNTGMKGDETQPTETTPGTTASESVETTATVKDGKAVAEVKAADVAKAIEKVGGEKADNKEVVLEIKGTNGADAIEAGIPAAAVKELDKADVDVAIKTEGGNVTIPADAMGNIAVQSGNNDLTVTMENKKPADAAAAAGGDENLAKEAGISSEALAGASITEVNMTAGGKNITSFGGSNIELYIPLKGNFVAGHSYRGAAISANGSIEGFIADCVKMAGQMFAKVKSGHLTTFVITNEEVKNPFTDVKSGDYFFQPVLWAVSKDVTGGVSETSFAPNAGCTRAQMVTFLWRAAGKPWASANRHFSDVADGAYYKDAIEWAIAAGITNGVSETVFDPNGAVTREQLASFIYRYAQSKGQGFTGAWMFLLDYSDASKISSWADEAMHWCVMKEIVGGTGNKMLSPQGTATRGQIVTMLYRYFNL